MCFAIYSVTSTTLGAITMHHNKETQEEIVLIEATVWIFWLLFFSVSYLLAKVVF